MDSSSAATTGSDLTQLVKEEPEDMEDTSMITTSLMIETVSQTGTGIDHIHKKPESETNNDIDKTSDCIAKKPDITIEDIDKNPGTTKEVTEKPGINDDVNKNPGTTIDNIDKNLGSTNGDTDKKPDTVSQSDYCVLMEYRTAGKEVGGDNDAGSEESSSSSDDSSDDSEDNEATDAKINKALSHQRDASPEGTRKIKLNRHGFEDIRTKGELLPEELPPLEELTITVDESVEMNCVGKIASIVGVLVVIQSSSDIPPLNDETILFVEGHKVLGQVFEVFGPVKSPWYSVRFNDPENIKGKDLKIGMPVYCAPKEQSFTKYVFVDSLKQMKGSDASWEDNNEPPDKYIEYSDDEAERQAKSKRKNKKSNQDGERDEENMGKRNKNAYNEQLRHHQTERANRGYCQGGNPRQNHPRGRGNPFQGQNQHPQNPRFASGQYRQSDSDRNSSGQFNRRWPGCYNDRVNDYENCAEDSRRFTADRRPNFGGPPRFRSGPQVHRSDSRPQYQPQNNQCFRNRNDRNPRLDQTRGNQNFFSSNQKQRFPLNSGQGSEKNQAQFMCSERFTSPPPSFPPSSGMFSQDRHVLGQFSPMSGSSMSDNQFQTSQVPPSVPSSMVIGQGTTSVFSCSSAQQGGQVSSGMNEQFTPHSYPSPTNRSHNVSNTSFPSQPYAMNYGQEGFSKYPQTINDSTYMANMPTPPNMHSDNTLQNNQSYGNQPMGNNFQNQVSFNFTERGSQTRQNVSDQVTMTANQQRHCLRNEQNMEASGTFPWMGNQNLVDNFGSRQDSAVDAPVGQLRNQMSGGHSRASDGSESQTLPFQDANYLSNMISAGLRQNNRAQVMDSRFVQNE